MTVNAYDTVMNELWMEGGVGVNVAKKNLRMNEIIA